MIFTKKMVQFVTGGAHNQESQALMIRKLNARNPYIDPLNVIQVELMKRIRDDKFHKLN